MKESVPITESQNLKLLRINRLYLVLSKINEAIVRIHDREKLFKEACRIVVEEGGFKMSWIGVVDPSTLLVKPTAHCCGEYEGSYIDGLVVSVKDVPEGRGPIGNVIRGGKHVICNNIENDPSMAPWRDKALRYGYRSSAAFPLRQGTDVIGTITVYSGEPCYFNKEEVELLDTLAADISFAIESIEMETQAKRTNEELRLLQTISIAVSEADNFHSALKVAISKICEATGCSFGEAWLPSADGQILEFDASYYSDGCPSEFIESSKTFKFQPGVGLPGRVWSSKKAEWIKDVTADISVFPRADGAVKAGLKAGFGVPIVAGDRVLTVLEFFTFKPREKDNRLIDIISAVSAQLGNVFLRKLSEERLLQSNNLLKAISNIQYKFISDIDPQVLFDGLLKDLLALTGSEYGFIGEIFYNTDGSPYLKTHAITNIAWNDETRALYEKYAPAFEFRNLKSLFGEVMTTGKPVISNNPASDPRRCGLPEGHPPLNAFLGLPFYSGNNLIGMVGIANRQNGYDEKLIEYLQPFLSTCSNIITAYRVKRQANLAEKERFSAQQKYEGLVNNLPIGVFRNTTGDRECFVEANPALIAMLEADSKEELFSHYGLDFYEDKGRRQEIIDKIQKDGFIENEEVDIITLKGNRRRVSVSSVLKKEGEGNIYLDGVVEDITMRKNLEAQLMQSQKMEAVGQLAGGIAHDFNNALTAILGFGKLLLMKKGDDELIKNYAQHIVGAGEGAAGLVQRILAFSRKQTIIPQPVDIGGLVKNLKNILPRLVGEDIELRTALPDSSMIVKADPTQIEQILLNLATNARDAMPGGGSITIGAEPVIIDAEFVNAHGYAEAGRYVMLSFADTGMGMDEETRKRIFELFFTTKEVGKGTGLGLAMAYGIVKQHGGFINVYSEPGKGTTFRIYLPLIERTVDASESREVIIPQRGTETLFLIEDDESVREITLTVLEDFGYNVIVAVDGEDAVSKFKENRDRIDLCISDMVMPKKGGREAFEEMRKIRPGLRVIFMSGYAADKTKGIIEEGLDFVSKPVSPSELLRKVREVLDR